MTVTKAKDVKALTCLEITRAGPVLYVAGIAVRSWLGTASNDEARELQREVHRAIVDFIDDKLRDQRPMKHDPDRLHTDLPAF